MNKKVIALFPNILTTFGFASGFFSILYAIENAYFFSVMAIFVAVIFDVFDGMAARLTQTNSTFGMNYDSLSDLLSFGIAPAVLVGVMLSEIAWVSLVCVFYAICINIRLARFNSSEKTKYFKGLPAPSCALCVVSLLLLLQETGWLYWDFTSFIFLGVVLSIALLAVSSVRYEKSKNSDDSKVSFRQLFLIALISTLIFWKPMVFMPIVSYLYLFIGLYKAFIKKQFRVLK